MHHRPARRRASGTFAVVFLTLAVYYVSLFGYRLIVRDNYNDLRVLHGSAFALRWGQDLYWSGPATWDGARNLNPPHVIALMAPLGYLTVHDSALIMFVLMAVAAIATFFAAARVFPKDRALLLLGIMVLSGPSTATVTLVNLSWFLTAATVWAWVWARGAQTRKAAVTIGCLATVKLFFLIFAPLWLWKRNWRALGWAAAAFVGIFATAVALMGVDVHLTWLEMLQNKTPIQAGGYRHFDAAVHSIPLRWTWPHNVQVAIGAAAAAGVLAVAGWRLRENRNVDVEWAVVLCAMLLVSPLGWVYYWLLPALPVAAVLLTDGPRWGRIIATTGFVVPPMLIGILELLSPPLLKPFVASFGSVTALATFAALCVHHDAADAPKAVTASLRNSPVAP